MAKAIDFPFRIEQGQFAVTSDYRRIVRAQVIDYVTTNYRERLMSPTWGSDIQSLLFSPSDQLRRSDAENTIAERVNSNIPNATVVSVDIVPDENDPALVVISIGYRASDYDETEVLSIPMSLDYTTVDY